MIVLLDFSLFLWFTVGGGWVDGVGGWWGGGGC